MKQRRFLLVLLSSFILISFFLFLRVYKLPSSLDFIADMGRDHYVLWQWVHSRKPPLLGPGNSLLPINQSPLFYYILFPVFLLSAASPYTSVITVLFVYVTLFVFGLYVCIKQKWIRRILFLFALLLTLQPEFIKQLRNPWNPSFIAPFLALGTLCLLVPAHSHKRTRIFVCLLSLLAALGFSYSVFPIVVLLLSVAFIKWKSDFRILIASLVGAVLVVFGPMLYFEVRHSFFFTKRLLLDHTLTSEGSIHFFGNMQEIFFIFLGVRSAPFALLTALFIIGDLFLSFRSHMKNEMIAFHKTTGLLLVVSLVITCLVPFSIIPHYAFGILVLLLLYIASMEKRLFVPAIILLLLIWVKPVIAGEYWKPARRTILQLEQCARLVCREEKSPMYVALQAWYPYHYAPDYLFFFNKYGCRAYDISNDMGTAKTLAVVADQASFELGKTSFNELTLFGPASLRKMYQCDATIHVYMLNPAKL